MSLIERAAIRLDHPVIGTVDPDLFRFTFAADCMTHACRCTEGSVDQQLDDACCRFGCDVDLYERDAILRRAAAVARVLPVPLQDPSRWFDESDPELDAESPSGVLLRTARHDMSREDGRCVFLQVDARGCALHRAAVEAAFDPAEIKPVVCRLYPLSLQGDALGLADDFDWYSCAHHNGPTVYRVMRETLAQIFGDDAVHALDRAEASIARRRLRVAG
jgi:Fe-S-cluster containining protein